MEKDTKGLSFIVMGKIKIKMRKLWTVWKFTIGSFSDERTKDHDI